MSVSMIFDVRTNEDDTFSGVFKPDRRRLLPIVQQTNPADRGGGEDRRAAAGRLAFVVETDVAAHDREVERPARVAHPAEALDELGHDFRPLRVAEVEA